MPVLHGKAQRAKEKVPLNLKAKPHLVKCT
jgi:hypothetical protein